MKNALLLVYFALVLSYAAWKGNAQALEEKIYHNSKGELVYPVVTKSMEQVRELGNSLYYTGTDGQRYVDINEQTVLHFNWETFFQVMAFGCGLALLLLLIIRLSTRFAKENP